MKNEMKKVFVTGTDTGVGKTTYSCLLLRDWMRVVSLRSLGYVKPFQTGGVEVHDSHAVFKTGISKDNVHLLRSYEYASSVHLAAQKEGRTVDYQEVIRETKQRIDQYPYLVMEGAGGLMVPLVGRTMMIDFMKAIDLPVILVGRLGLGTLNHTLMSLWLLKQWKLTVIKVVLNAYFGSSEEDIHRDNVRYIEEYSGITTEVF